MSIRIKVHGLREALAGLEDGERKMDRAFRKWVYKEGLEVQYESMRRTPVDTGALRGSHHTEPPPSSGRAKVVVGVGGAAAPYAWKVHEDLNARHTTGEAKFLEKAVLERQRGLPERLASLIREVLDATE